VDIETFKTLAEIVAFECRDSAKRTEFNKIYYGDYQHKTRTFIDLEAMNGNVTVNLGGKHMVGLIANYSMSHDTNEYDIGGGYSMRFSTRPSFTLKVEIKGSF